MISHHTEDTLIVVGSRLRGEGDYDTSLRLGINGPFNLREGENILIVSKELESRWEVTVVTNVEKSVSVTS